MSSKPHVVSPWQEQRLVSQPLALSPLPLVPPELAKPELPVVAPLVAPAPPLPEPVTVPLPPSALVPLAALGLLPLARPPQPTASAATTKTDR
jgi:hypothetical protein